jgi:hypothetical protein
MNNNSKIVSSVLAGKNIVNRAEKMERTINIMVSNAKKRVRINGDSNTQTKESDHGYGHGKNMGD